MSRLLAFEPVALEGLWLRVGSDGIVLMSGKITLRNPREELTPHIRALHEAAIADGVTVLTVDVKELSFVNSSAIRAFIDWAVWAKQAARYKLRFVTNPHTTWQRTSFAVLKSLAETAVEVT